ncbi:hypothetical protein B7494_g7148 [Chlorociboria aeruginascens]|nr:hypothetical protein B7494_g7148 [Chlorociboria aeruginascens]
MAGEQLLLTGATGHLGFRVLVLALRAGYKVRAAVRSQTGIDKILSAPSIVSINPGSNLTFIFVHDIIAPGAYDEALKDATYAIHCASPLATNVTNNEEEIIKPAVKGTTNLLESAKRNTSVKRVVITSSILAITSFSEFIAPSEKLLNESNRVPFNPGPYSSALVAYADSKVRALATTHEFVQMQKLGFDVINLMPSFIIGTNELITSISEFNKGTNHLLLDQVLGVSGDPRPGTTVWLDDVASIHVKALSPEVQGGEDFILTAEGKDGIVYADAKKVIAENFPKEVEKGVFKNDGTQPSLKLLYDTSKAEKTFGVKFEGVETQVLDIARTYLTLLAKKEERP